MLVECEVAVLKLEIVQVIWAFPKSDACFVVPSCVRVIGIVIFEPLSLTVIVELVNCMVGGISESLKVIV